MPLFRLFFRRSSEFRLFRLIRKSRNNGTLFPSLSPAASRYPRPANWSFSFLVSLLRCLSFTSFRTQSCQVVRIFCISYGNQIKIREYVFTCWNTEMYKINYMSCGDEWHRLSFPTLKTNIRHLFLPSYGAECYRHSFPTLKTNTQHLFLASYGAKCYRHSFPTLKTNTQHLFLASYGAECYRHSFPTLKTNTRYLFLASYGAECYRHSLPTLLTNTQHLRRYGAECYRHSFPTSFLGPLNFLLGQLKMDN